MCNCLQLCCRNRSNEVLEGDSDSGEGGLSCYGGYSVLMHGLGFAATCCELSITSWS